MTHHQFGAIVGDTDIGGTFALNDAVLLRDKTTLAVESLSNDERLPVVALQLAGRVNKTQDTVQAVFVMAAMDAAALARMLLLACERMSPTELVDFECGWAEAAS